MRYKSQNLIEHSQVLLRYPWSVGLGTRLWYPNLLDLPLKIKKKERDYGTLGEGCSSQLSGHICAI